MAILKILKYSKSLNVRFCLSVDETWELSVIFLQTSRKHTGWRGFKQIRKV